MTSNKKYWISIKLANKIKKKIKMEEYLPYTKEDEVAVTRAINGYKEEFKKNGFIYGEKLS